VNASPLPSSSIHHQEVTFGTQAAGNWLFHQIPHRIYGTSVAAEILPVSGDLFDKATLRVTDLCQHHITFGCNAAVAFCTISHHIKTVFCPFSLDMRKFNAPARRIRA
jgi:hypothetical protein